MSDGGIERIALVGPSSIVGREIKARLAEAGYPGNAIDLLDLDEHVGLLTEYGDEARVVLEVAEESLREHGLACFCGDATTARRFVPAVVESGGLAIDCTGVWASDPTATLVAGATGSEARAGLVAIAHPGTLLLSALHHALGEDTGGASATLLLPASEASEAGPEELAQQSSAFMTLADSPDQIFGRRLAFDLYPATTTLDYNVLIAEQLRLLDLPTPALASVRAPIFHGLAASLHLPADAASVRERLEATGFGVDQRDDDDNLIDSPARLTGIAGLHAAVVRDDGKGGTWLWLLLDNYRATADAALRVITAHMKPPPEPVV